MNSSVKKPYVLLKDYCTPLLIQVATTAFLSKEEKEQESEKQEPEDTEYAL